MARAAAARIKTREAMWRRVVAGHARSGLSIRAYCVQRGVKEPAFYWWRSQLARRDAARPAAFVPVVVESMAPTASVSAGDIRMELRGGQVLRLPASMTMEQVGALVRAIEGAA